MFSFTPFKRKHLLPLLLQDINSCFRVEFLDAGLLERIERTEAFTGMWNDQVMFCGGVSEIWKNRGHVWILFSEESKENFIPVFRGLKRFLMEHRCRRIEVSILPHLEFAKRRAKMLGFVEETPLARCYSPEGHDCSIFSLVKEGLWAQPL